MSQTMSECVNDGCPSEDWFVDGQWGTGTGFTADQFQPIPIPSALLTAVGRVDLSSECLPPVKPADVRRGRGRGLVVETAAGAAAAANDGHYDPRPPAGVYVAPTQLSIEQQLRRVGLNTGTMSVRVEDHIVAPAAVAAPVAPAQTAAQSSWFQLDDNVGVRAVEGPGDAVCSATAVWAPYVEEPAPDIDNENDFPPLAAPATVAPATAPATTKASAPVAAPATASVAAAVDSRTRLAAPAAPAAPAAAGDHSEQLVAGSCRVLGATSCNWPLVLEWCAQFGELSDSTSWTGDDGQFFGWLRFENPESFEWMLDVFETKACDISADVSFHR